MRKRTHSAASYGTLAVAIALLAGPFVVLAIGIITSSESPPMSQEQVEDFFDTNYDALVIVTAFLAEINLSREIEVSAIGETSVTLRTRREAEWIRSEREDAQVAEAIHSLRQQRIRPRIRKNQDVIRFQLDSRGQWSNYGPLLRIGIAYATTGRDLSMRDTSGGMHVEYIPLATPNWFFYMIKDITPAS